MILSPLRGQTAIVTGGSRRIGREIALHLARAGANVAVNTRSSVADAEAVVNEIISEGGQAMVAVADVTEPAAVKAMVSGVVERFGGVEILVHNAVARDHAPLEELTLDAWRQSMSIVLDGAFLCAQQTIPYMEKAGKGAIVFIGGASAFLGSSGPALPTAKSGLVGLTRSLALTYGEKGIRVNLLSPGWIEAETDSAANRERISRTRPVDKIPLRRTGNLQDVARSVTSLVGPDFDYMTGQTLHLAGGLVMQ